MYRNNNMAYNVVCTFSVTCGGVVHVYGIIIQCTNVQYVQMYRITQRQVLIIPLTSDDFILLWIGMLLAISLFISSSSSMYGLRFNACFGPSISTKSYQGIRVTYLDRRAFSHWLF